ncbi:MAG: TonB-dependent receptor [Bacteroidia bacterium]
MKKYLFMSLAVCAVSFTANAQTLKVRDNSTSEPVADAAIYAQTPQPNIRIWGTTTNNKGEADISAIAGQDSLYIRHPNYGTQGYKMADVKNAGWEVRLISHSYMMPEFVYSANKSEEEKKDVPYTISVVKEKDIAFSNPQTSADMLMNTGDVFVQKSQMGAGSPVIRGFEANKVLIVVDGVRMNNAIYRGGHLQDVITIDPSMLERTEVVYGPSSVIYGSDALGGTMHFYSRKPILAQDSGVFSKGNAYYRYSSANKEQTGHFDFNIGFRKIAFLTSITRSEFDDLRIGSKGNPLLGDFGWCKYYVERINGIDSVIKNPDPLVQRGTGYSQLDLNQKILWAPSAKFRHLLNVQYSTSSNIPRYDRLVQLGSDGLPRYARWDYGPQNRLLASYSLMISGDSSGWFSNGTVVGAFQKIDQDRITRRRNNNNEISQMEDVRVYSLNADFKHHSGKHEFRYGVEFTYNDVQSSAIKKNIVTSIETPDITRYPDGGSSMMTTAAYFSHSWEINEKLIVSEGLRMSYVNLNSKWNDTTFFPFPFKSVTQSNVAPSGTIGIVYMPISSLRFHVNGSTGFRAPNVDDMSKVFESTQGNLIVPNPNLKPEYVYGGEAGAGWEFTSYARLEFTGFYSYLTNAIVAKKYSLNGADSVLFDGAMSQVIASQNVDKAFIYGYSAAISADLSNHFSFRSTLNWTYGRYNDVQNDTLIPLDHIPPMFGQTGLVFHTKKFEAELFSRYNGWKRLADYSPSGEDNLSQATPYGMPAWATVNFRSAYQINNWIRVSAGVENIFDVHYRHFASGVSAPGRNYVVSLRMRY